MAPDFQTADGRIQLYNADCLAVLDALPDRSIDLVFMDPPYGHKNNGGNDLIRKKYVARGLRNKGITNRAILNDGEEATPLLASTLDRIKRVLRDNSCCCCCCCGGGGPDPQFARWSLLIDDRLNFKQMVVWDKGRMGMGWHYRRSYETVLVAQKGKGRCRWYDRSRRVENIIRPGDYGIRKVIPRQTDHPTAKPVALPRHFIRLHSAPGDVVLDPFMGGGSTLCAAYQEGRRFVGIELDPEHFERSVSAAESLTRTPAKAA